MSSKKSKKKATALPARKAQRSPAFSDVSTISTAPVAIGNSIRGSKPVITQISDGVRIYGRDFAFGLGATVAAVTGWTLIGGMPLTPAVLPSSALRSYVQMYSKFKVNKINVHYITSSPTTQAGDVMFYYERDFKGPMMDFSSSSFLPFVLSDPLTIIGPQWTNHTLTVQPTDDWNFTDYGLNADLNQTTCGAIYLFSKTASASSPGYALLDYDMSFKEMSVSPRAGYLPVSRGQFAYLNIGVTASAVTINATGVAAVVQGNTPDGVASALPTGALAGDIYKFVADFTASTASGVNSAWTNVTAGTLLDLPAGAGNTAQAVDDGFTCYLQYSGSNTLNVYPSLEAAIVGSNSYRYGVTATITWNLCGLVSLVYAGVTTAGQTAY